MMFDLQNPMQLTLALLPEVVLSLGAMVLMLYSAFRPESDEHQRRVGYGSLVVLMATLVAVIYMASTGATTPSDGILAVDNFRWVVSGVVLLGAAGTVALSIEHNARAGIIQGESHVLVLMASLGMMVLGAGRELMVVFLGIEIMSVAVYILVGMNRRSVRSAEASLKYFLLGAFATAFLLYGVALVYGATGVTTFEGIRSAIHQHDLYSNTMLWIGIGLMLVGFGFKVAAVPFHMWAPDVYDGAPTPITAFMAAIVKAAAFATFLRLWYESFFYMASVWIAPLWWLAVATMLVGNVVALQQRNIKRMLAYSSIVHAGYLLVAVAASSALGSTAFLFYIFAYTLATFGAFGVVIALQSDGDKPLMISDFQGLWHIRPGVAIMMAVFMLSMLGFPVFGGIGFFAKWYLLQAALASSVGLATLAVILVLTSVISAGYYLNVVRVMFMKERPEGLAEPAAVGALTRAVLTVSAVLILAFGIFPAQVAKYSQAGSLEPYPYSRAMGIRVPAPLR